MIFYNNDLNVFTIHVIFNVGPILENEGERGWSHLLEHMLFKSKKHYKVQQLVFELNSLGGVFNAITNKDFTCFYIIKRQFISLKQ
jgi:zinc protease